MSDNYKEEIFCLKFELDTLAEFTLFNHVERWVNGFVHKEIHNEHMARYEFAKKFSKDKNVLDIACGSGYGSFILATEGGAKYVTGLDLDANSIRYAEHRYKNPNISRIVGDAVKYKFDNQFDLIVSYETIEHIENYEELLIQFDNCLCDNGTLLISSPLVKETTRNSINRYHVIEWSFYDFQKLIEERFIIEEIYLQNIMLADDFKPLSRIKRLMNKLIGKEYFRKTKRQQLLFEKENGQYKINDIHYGYQLCVCKKRNK